VTVSHALVGTFTADASLTVRTWDDSLAQASGIASAQAVGRPLIEVIPSIATRGLLTRFEEVVASGAVHVFSPGLHRYLLPCPPAAPSRRFEHMQQRVTLGPLRDGDRITGVMVAIEDVTTRLEAERDLAEALAAGNDSWKARRAVVQELSQHQTADFALSLVSIIRTHHRDFSVLSSSLQLLAGTGTDVSEALAGLLHDPDPDLRIQAALALGQQRSPAAADALIRTLDDDDPNVQFQAVESLGRLGAVAAVDHLARIAESGTPLVAFAAIDALGAIKDARVAAALVPLLDREDLRPAVISTLGAIGDEAAVAPLTRMLNRDATAAVPIAQAITAIFHRLEYTYQQGVAVAHAVTTTLEPSGVRHLLDAVEATPGAAPSVAPLLGWTPSDEGRRALVRWLAFPNAQTAVISALVAQGGAVVPLLIDQLAATEPEVRRGAVAALGHLGLPRATHALVALLDEAPELSSTVAGALARIGDPEAFEGLVKLLGHREAGVRQAAIGALNAISHPAMPSRIVSLLDSDNPRLRESAIRIAGYFGYPSARARVLQLTSDPDDDVQCAAIEHVPFFNGEGAIEVLLATLARSSAGARAAAVRALGHIHDDRASVALVEALRDDVFWVRYYAARALAERRAAGAVSALKSAALNDAAPPVRIAATEALGLIDPGAAADVFIALTAEAIDELAAAAVTALARVGTTESQAAVLRAVHDNRRVVRLAAVSALADEPRGETVSVLQRTVATDPDDHVRRSAVDALSELARRADQTGADAAEILVAMLIDAERGQDAAAALARLPAGRLPIVARHLHHPDPATRRAVVETLGRSRHSEATTLLFDALNDETAVVREAAVLALGRRRHVV
jgi:HEAT repeat protein